MDKISDIIYCLVMVPVVFLLWGVVGILIYGCGQQVGFW
jgi:hypothetical protein